MNKKTSKKNDGGSILTSQEQLNSFLKQNKESHFNFEETINYRVPSGSMTLDYYLDGGLGTGLHRFVGMNEGGKTSCALQFLKNFLDVENDNRKGFYIKAEGRLGEEIASRSGVKFVTNTDEWEEGTCFVFETNIYETAVDAMRQLVGRNQEKNKYFFIIDSVDGLLRKDDLDKTFEESQKVAGGAVVAGTFMKKCAAALQKRGHIAIFISQVRDDIKLDPYSKAPIRQTLATGGNALLHFANWILQFEARNKSDLILQDEKAAPDAQKNPYIGHQVKVTVKKSPNEKTNLVIKYPIRYGRKNGTSNWIEKEISDFILGWDMVIKKGAWLSFAEDVVENAKRFGVDLSNQIQGMPKLEALISDNEDVKKFFIGYIKQNVLSFLADDTDGTSDDTREEEEV
jgi:RecA/RadA recombinase